MDKVTVTYIKHSGFLVETKESYLLFDYWEGKLPELQYDKELYVFSSHAHHDHYTKDIFKLENYCTKWGIKLNYLFKKNIITMSQSVHCDVL